NYPDNNLKGEIVLIIEGAKEEQNEVTLEDAINIAKDYTEKGMSKNDAAKTAAHQTGHKKSDIYKALQ
ncbi:MAG: 16S rRNA (cytidine(1402)-2'-O)-methyltransferase, partial [Clostridia bacterium]|nr:16S rRNA (cytidine(1402)-2'-O)-methyltransferase [Clostridia bacterium]